MKKLMFVAAAAAMTIGAQAELCEEDVSASGCSVYNVKITLKTLAAKKKSCSGVYLAEGDASDKVQNGVWVRYVSTNGTYPGVAQPTASYPAAGYTVNQKYYEAWETAGSADTTTGNSAAWYGDVYWADNTTRTLEGLLWQCTASCFEGDAIWNGNGSGEIYYALWEKKTEKVFSYPVFKYYKNSTMDAFNWITADETPNFDWMGRYGQKANKIGIYWCPSMKGWTADWLDCVGFGTFDVKNLRIKSVTGGVLGEIAPYVVGEEDECGDSSYFKIQIAYVCQKFSAWCCDPCYAAVDWVPAYGNWSLKYNASLSSGKKPLSKILPEYAIFSETGDAAFTNGFDTKGIFEYLNGSKGYTSTTAIVTAGQTYVDNNTL